MKDEIKEILEFDFQSQGERIEINEYERNILKDYITNLQQKYEEADNDRHKLFEQKEKTIELLNRHDIDTGDIYYKYNGRFVKSELKERIREILGGDEEC